MGIRILLHSITHRSSPRLLLREHDQGYEAENFGRSDTIRTCDLLHPMQTRYQLRYAPTDLEGYPNSGIRARARASKEFRSSPGNGEGKSCTRDVLSYSLLQLSAPRRDRYDWGSTSCVVVVENQRAVGHCSSRQVASVQALCSSQRGSSIHALVA